MTAIEGSDAPLMGIVRKQKMTEDMTRSRTGCKIQAGPNKSRE